MSASQPQPASPNTKAPAAPVPPDFRERMLACWLGKAVGGTLGMPYEGHDGPLDLTHYDPAPTEMLPNDDLDLQVVYAVLLDRDTYPEVAANRLLEAWSHIGMSPDEYGICKRNLELGLDAPDTGAFDNPFEAGMGAAIRTELWACLAPGRPARAAAFAWQDACMDHANDGIEAATYLAFIESHAFVERDVDTLLDAAGERLAPDGRLDRATRDVRRWWADDPDPDAIRDHILTHHGDENFTDVIQNLAFILLGLLAWRDATGSAGQRFGTGICTAVNCGKDTDCTGATLGALLGILDPAGLTDDWLAPIGRDLVLSPGIRGIAAPDTLDAFSDLVDRLRERLDACQPGDPDTLPEQIATRPGLLADTATAEIDWDTAANLETEGVETAFAFTPRRLAGQAAALDCPAGHSAIVRYRLTLDQPQRVRFVLNARRGTRLHVDGTPVLARAGGPVVPAIHRPPTHQWADVRLDAGVHRCVAFVEPDASDSSAQWFFGVADIEPDPLHGRWLTAELDWMAPPEVVSPTPGPRAAQAGSAAEGRR